MAKEAKKKQRPFYIVADVESTGLSGEKHMITQIGALVMDPITLEDVDAFTLYVKPYGKEVDQRAMTYTGLTLDFLEKEGVEQKEACRLFIEFINRFRPSKHASMRPLPIGQNFQFDIQMMIPFFRECGENFYEFFQDRYLDTLCLANMAFDNDESMPNFKLATIAEKLEIEEVQYHDAMNDVFSTADIFRTFAKKLRNNNSPSDQEETKKSSHRLTFQF